MSRSTGETYYHNTGTGETTYDWPQSHADHTPTVGVMAASSSPEKDGMPTPAPFHSGAVAEGTLDADDAQLENRRREAAAKAASLSGPRARHLQQCAANDPSRLYFKWCGRKCDLGCDNCRGNEYGAQEMSLLAAVLYRNTSLQHVRLCCNRALDDAAVAPLLEVASDPRYGGPIFEFVGSGVTAQTQARLGDCVFAGTLHKAVADSPSSTSMPTELVVTHADSEKVLRLAEAVAGTKNLQCLSIHEAGGPSDEYSEDDVPAICADAFEALARAVAQSGVVGYNSPAQVTDYDDLVENERTASLRGLHEACVANAVRRVRANDPELIRLGWNGMEFLTAADVSALAEALVGNTHLKEIYLLSEWAVDETIAPLCAALPHSAVTWVGPPYNVSATMKSKIIHLTTPNLCAVVARDEPQTPSALRSMAVVTRVDWGNQNMGIGDAEVGQLAMALRGTGNVRDVDLRGTPGLTDDGLDALLCVVPTCKVEVVDLGDNPGLSDHEKIRQLDNLCDFNGWRNKALQSVRTDQRLCLAKLFYYEGLATGMDVTSVVDIVARALQKTLTCPKGEIAAARIATNWLEAMRQRREQRKCEQASGTSLERTLSCSSPREIEA